MAEALKSQESDPEDNASMSDVRYGGCISRDTAEISPGGNQPDVEERPIFVMHNAWDYAAAD